MRMGIGMKKPPFTFNLDSAERTYFMDAKILNTSNKPFLQIEKFRQKIKKLSKIIEDSTFNKNTVSYQYFQFNRFTTNTHMFIERCRNKNIYKRSG